MKKKVLVILCSLLVFLLIGCGGSSNSLFGRWANNDETAGDSFEFFSDGTGIVNYNDGTSYSINWIAENERLKISMDMGMLGEWSSSCGYKLDKDSLTLDDGEGNIATYTKIK